MRNTTEPCRRMAQQRRPAVVDTGLPAQSGPNGSGGAEGPLRCAPDPAAGAQLASWRAPSGVDPDMIDQAGFSLVELMIAMSLGLVLTAAVATLALNAAQSYRSLYLAGEQIENGRYALMTLKDDLEHAGYWGVFSPSSAKLTLPATMPDPCDHGPENLANHFFLPLTGTGFTCLEDLIGRIEGTDVLAIRRIESSAPDAAAIPQTLSTTRTYFQANPGDYIIATDCELVSGQVNCTSSWGLRGASPRFTLVQPDNSLANIREYHADLYYIRSWSTSPGDGIPALVRLAAARSDATPEAVIDGIQNMQILFGLDGVLTNETNCNN
ncbi:MAG: prepilin-type N-terminal cleavage/methylation domain-containing protein, partial [Gammaproteobacteria bacterium]|nr:prepilin-type N-terminal cleavage/methylation domain-containing protein [Gammaproteobacteria bacterium]